MPTANGTSNGRLTQVARPVAAPTPRDLQREYVAGGSYGYVAQYAQALPSYIDDLTADFGEDLYVRMLLDPQIAACVAVMKASILEDGANLNSAVDDADEDGYELAKQITDECERMLDDMETSLDDVLWNLMDDIAEGNKLGEQIFELRSGSTINRKLLQLSAIKVKPRSAYLFVVDAYLNTVGILGRLPGMAGPTVGTWYLNTQQPPDNLLSPQKFAIATFRPKDGDPRGTSILRPAYDPWWRKRQLYMEHLRFATQLAGPSLIGFTAEDSESMPTTDDLGNVLLDQFGNVIPPTSPVTQMQAALQAFRNGTAAAFPGGASVQVIEAKTDGSAFLKGIAECNMAITKAILTQQLATEEGEHQARAAAEVHQDVLDTLVRQGKRSVVRMLVKQVIRPWVAYNFGEKVAANLTPKVSLGTTEERDLAPMMTAVAQLMTSGYIHPSQMPEIDDELGLPVRDLSQDPEVVTNGEQAPPAAPGQPAPNPAPAAKPVPQGPPAGQQKEEPVPPNKVQVRPHLRGKPKRRPARSLWRKRVSA